MATDELASGPLTGLRAIEFGQLLAGPFVGTLLADFGADVVKVEAPPAGDPMREWGQLRHNDHSLWWSVLSRNKRSVALNLREPRGQEIAAELCAGADVIVENFRPGTMERWGIGPEQVHAVNPGCIYARVSGYGQSGSYRDRAGFAAGGEAIAGLRYINGYPDQAPPRSGISLGDTLAAQSAFQGILMALYARDARGATRPGRRRGDRRRLLRDDRVADRRLRQGRLRARAHGPAAAQDRAQQRLSLERRQVGRDRGEPRHALEAPGRAHGASRSGATTRASPTTPRAASTRPCWTS